MGLDSLWVLDRLFRPRHPLQRVAGEEARPLPEFYGNVNDPLESLTFAAALTERVLLGTSVINALFHPPVILGKRFATLDRLSGGRAIAGLGQGWMAQEFAVSGVPMRRRGEGMAEYVAALQAVWGPDPVAFDGRFYQIPESDIGPKPEQAGGIPIFIGAFSRGAIERAGRMGVGLNPLAADYGRLVWEVETFRAAAQAAGWDAEALPVIARANATLTESPLPDEGRGLFAGTVSQWLGDLERVAGLGIGHVFFSIDEPVEVRMQVMGEVRRGVG